jgi:predicted dehydrogenase
MPAKTTCNIGFIGCGALMNVQHIQNAHKSTVCTVHTLCDINPEAIAKTAAKFPPRKTTADYKELLADPEVDLVVIAMNPNMHAKLTIEALKAGKPVYVEKPLGESAEEGLEIARLARKKKLPVAVGFNRRFSPAYRDVKACLEGRRGPLLTYYRIADLERGKRADTLRLHVEDCHMFDILTWLVGKEPAAVFATEGAHNENTVTVQFEDGSSALVLSSGRASPAAPKEHLELVWDRKEVWVEDFVEARFFGLPQMPALKRYRGRAYTGSGSDHVDAFAEKGLEYYLDLKKKIADAHDEAEAGRKGDPVYMPYPGNYLCDKGWSVALEEMARAVIEGRAPANAGPVDGVRASVISEAALKSIKSGKAVKVGPADWRA